MAYQKQNFQDGRVLSASQLNKIEQGIVDNENALAQKQDKGDYVTKTEANNIYASKSDTYTKTEVDNKIANAGSGGSGIDIGEYLKKTEASDTYQEKLVSGANIKTINGQGILGSGNIVIEGSGGASTTQVVTQTITVTSTPVVLDSGVLEQSVSLNWNIPEQRVVPAFQNVFVNKGKTIPRKFNTATEYVQYWKDYCDSTKFVSGHTYLVAMHLTMDGDSTCSFTGSSGTVVSTSGNRTFSGTGWAYFIYAYPSTSATTGMFDKSSTGTGTIDYLYCVDVTALRESGAITTTSSSDLAKIFGELKLLPSQDYEGSTIGGKVTMTISRGGEQLTVTSDETSAVIKGGDTLVTDTGSATFLAKVEKVVSSGGSGGGGGVDWSDKKWVAFGDSLTDESINADKKYYRHIAERTGIKVTVMGVGGTGYIEKYDAGIAYGQRMVNVPSDADIITIFGSINDWKPLNTTGGYQVGSPSDTLESGTYSGYVNDCIDTAISKAPYAQIALIAPMYYRGIKTTLQESITEALKAVANHRRIKFLDLYHGSGFRIENDTFAKIYTTDYSETDETFGHPSNLAHEQLIAPEFMELLRKMLLS